MHYLHTGAVAGLTYREQSTGAPLIRFIPLRGTEVKGLSRPGGVGGA